MMRTYEDDDDDEMEHSYAHICYDDVSWHWHAYFGWVVGLQHALEYFSVFAVEERHATEPNVCTYSTWMRESSRVEIRI